MRRFLQFRLRTLFVLTAMVALLAWLVPPQIERYREYRARLERERLASEIDRLILARLATTPFIDREDLQIDYIPGGFFPDVSDWFDEEVSAESLNRRMGEGSGTAGAHSESETQAVRDE